LGIRGRLFTSKKHVDLWKGHRQVVLDSKHSLRTTSTRDSPTISIAKRIHNDKKKRQSIRIVALSVASWGAWSNVANTFTDALALVAGAVVVASLDF
jgi:hypothetical protein